MTEEPSLPGVTDSVLTKAELYQPPWRERMPNGELSSESYGPSTSAVLARQIRRYKDWSFRPVCTKSEESKQPDADEMRQFMRGGYGHLRTDIPEGELKTYVAVYEQGHAVRWCARQWGVRRETIKSWLKRLRARLSSAQR